MAMSCQSALRDGDRGGQLRPGDSALQASSVIADTIAEVQPDFVMVPRRPLENGDGRGDAFDWQKGGQVSDMDAYAVG